VGTDVDSFAMENPVHPALSQELLQSVCAPLFAQMCRSVTMQHTPAETMVSQDELRTWCEPFFEQMIATLQQTLQNPSSRQVTSRPTIGTYFQPVFYPGMPFFHMDGESTEADDSCAFTSLFSGTSSETDERPDATEIKPEGTEPTRDVERNSAVCRHWKSKGWCRLESKCKFSHPECEGGLVASVKGCANSGRPDTNDTEGGVASMLAEPRRKKRGGKNRSTKGQDQLGSAEQGDARP